MSGKNEATFRIEKDFLGEKRIPAEAYYGVQTQRGKDNFHITGTSMSAEPYFIKAFGYVKKAAAMANRDLGCLDGQIANAIIGACDRLIAGELRDQFVTLLAADEAGFNPFLALGNELVRDRHYAAAVSLFRLALELAPHNADAYVGLSKAYHFLRRPDLAERAVRKGLSLNERHLEARAIHRRLTGQTDTPEIPWASD